MDGAAAVAAVEEVGDVVLTSGQGACICFYLAVLVLWIYAEVSDVWERYNKPAPHAKDEKEAEPLTGVSVANGDSDAATEAGLWPTYEEVKNNNFVRCILLQPAAIKASRPVLRSIVEFGSIMLWWYCADRTTIIASVVKDTRLKDLWVVFAVLTAVAIATSVRQGKAPILLNRQQTEEWKGWMQVLFLLYHYFNTWQLYNAIRVFIAAYVWMTGFGNFAYYYKTGDFSLTRFAGMMWRLNFLVTITCIVLRNSYMLYYICPMHTLFTVMVYAVLGIANRYNKTNGVIWAKIVASFVVVYICWDIKPVFYAIWSPFLWLLGYTDPRRPGDDPLHEWYFRSSLDRYIWVYGMICAYVHPTVEGWIKKVEDMEPTKRAAIKGAVVAGALGVGYVWFEYVYKLPKLEYNAIHPYTSFIPLTVFMVLRNVTPWLRSHAVTLYGWLGCITLETYIGQFHTWLRTEIPDGQPKLLLGLVPGSFGINFVVCTAVYVFVSYRLFHLTNDLKIAAIPNHCNRELLRNTLLMVAAGAVAYGAGHILSISLQ